MAPPRRSGWRDETGGTSPRWLAAVTRNLKGFETDEDLPTYWKRARREEIERQARYEEVLPPARQDRHRGR